MTSPSGGPHPTTETISDLLEGLLPPAEGRAAALHLDQCATCQSVRDSLVHTHHVLGQAGQAPVTIPPDVFAQVESSLREEASARSGTTGVASLSTARERRRPGWGTRILVAAAGIAVLGGGGAVVYQVAGDSGSSLEAGPAPSDTGPETAAEQTEQGSDPQADQETDGDAAVPDTPGSASDSPSALTLSTFDAGVRELLDQRPSVGDESGPAAEPDTASTLDPALMACVSQATTQAGAGQILVADETTLDGADVVLAVTTSTNPDEVHAYAVAGCDAAGPPEVVHDQAVNTD